jgi:hypothetical protein
MAENIVEIHTEINTNIKKRKYIDDTRINQNLIKMLNMMFKNAKYAFHAINDFLDEYLFLYIESLSESEIFDNDSSLEIYISEYDFDVQPPLNSNEEFEMIFQTLIEYIIQYPKFGIENQEEISDILGTYINWMIKIFENEDNPIDKTEVIKYMIQLEKCTDEEDEQYAELYESEIITYDYQEKINEISILIERVEKLISLINTTEDIPTFK